MYKKVLFLFAFTFLTHLFCNAQINLQGSVKDLTTQEKIEFAHIAVQNASDTTKILYSAITDMEGSYLIENIPIGRYRFIISCIGYEPLTISTRITMSSAGQVLIKNFDLKPSVTQLNETVVTASRNNQKIDHRSIVFTSEEMKRAQMARDLLKNISGVKEDLMSGKLTTNQGNPLILINGVRSTENELRAIAPNKVKRVDYYDFPPARYASATCVINVVTKQLDNGYSLGINTSNALTTGFSNSGLFYAATKGNSIFHIEYNFNYRNYKDCFTQNSYKYALNGVNCLDETSGKEKFGYATHNISLKYTYTQLDKKIFQVTLTPNIERIFSTSNNTGVYVNGSSALNIISHNTDKTHTFNPSIDLYYWQKFGEKNELTANVTTTFFETNGKNKNNQYVLPGNSLFFQDEMNLNNKKSSLIGEVIYTHKIGLGNINTGYRFDYSHLFSDLENLKGSYNYTSNILQQRIYASIDGAKNRFMYQLNLGFTLLNSKSAITSYHRTLFNPQFILGYKLSNKSTLRFVSVVGTNVPTVTQLSNNVKMTSKDIYYSGNPNLRNEYSYTNALLYNFYSKYLDLELILSHLYKTSPIIGYYNEEGNHFIYNSVNGNYAYTYGGRVNASIKPFGTNLLRLQITLDPCKNTISTAENKFSVFSCPNYFSLDFNYKNWSANYTYSIPTYSAEGIYKTRSEEKNDFSIAYQLKNWKFSLGMVFIGKDATYITKTNNHSIVQEYLERSIRDNKSMCIFGIEFNFNSGKNKSISRKIENKDTDAPIF